MENDETLFYFIDPKTLKTLFIKVLDITHIEVFVCVHNVYNIRTTNTGSDLVQHVTYNICN